MPKEAKNGGREVLRAAWERWTRFLEAYAQGKHGRLKPREYADLHRRMLLTARAMATASLGEEKEFYEYLEGLAKPWGTPEALSRADREILANLLDRCQDANRRLNPKRGRSLQFLGKLAAALGAGVAVALLSVAIVQLNDTGRMPEFSRDLGFWLDRLGHTEKILAAAAVVSILGLAVLRGVARR